MNPLVLKGIEGGLAVCLVLERLVVMITSEHCMTHTLVRHIICLIYGIIHRVDLSL